MRFLLAALALAAPAAAFAQASAPGLPTATLDAIRLRFPLDHQGIAAAMAGKPLEEARRAAFAGIDAFLRARRQKIVAAAPAAVVGLESRHGAMLRSLQKSDVRLCARIGDAGFFSAEAASGPNPEGLDAYGVALVEAAAGGGSAFALPPTQSDVREWMKRVEAIEPAVPVQKMLTDRSVRAASSADQLCRGAAALHEAAATLPAPAGERISRMLLGAVIGEPVAR